MSKSLQEAQYRIKANLQSIMGLPNTTPDEKLEAVRGLLMLCEDLEGNLEHQTLKTKQEPKYQIKGAIVNRQSGVAIPDDEPIFILRAKDATAVATLGFYLAQAKGADSPVESLQAIQKRIEQFQHFAEQYPERMKNPDTTLTPDWDNL